MTITNCSNNYGPRQFPEKVIPLFLTNALDDRELPLYASTQNRREWLHVDDHCRAIELVLEQGREGETYNVGSGVERSIEEIADLVLELTGKPESLKTIVPDRPGPRPPLPARLHEAPARARLAAADLVRGRAARDGRVVRRQPRLVGAAEGAGAGARDDAVELSRGVLVTGADGQLGAALCEEFADVGVVALTRAEWDVTLPPPAGPPGGRRRACTPRRGRTSTARRRIRRPRQR